MEVLFFQKYVVRDTSVDRWNMQTSKRGSKMVMINLWIIKIPIERIVKTKVASLRDPNSLPVSSFI